MEKWQAEIKLRFKGLFKITVRFSFEWKAWLLAYELFDCSPSEFQKYDLDKQFTAICYGAAMWDRMKRGKSVFFTYDNIVQALASASKADNQKLAKTMEYAQFPEWLKAEGDKKKVT